MKIGDLIFFEVARAAQALAPRVAPSFLKLGHPDEIKATKISLGRRINTDFHEFLNNCTFTIKSVLAIDRNLSVYDTLYFALAEDHGAVVFTADLRLQKIAAQLRLQ